MNELIKANESGAMVATQKEIQNLIEVLLLNKITKLKAIHNELGKYVVQSSGAFTEQNYKIESNSQHSAICALVSHRCFY